ncbi:MAG: hypothetical protein AAB515_00460 [Patescibacteria group bacterium]
MISHPLLEPKKAAPSSAIANLAQGLATREPEELSTPVSPYLKSWLVVMVVYGLLALLAFMLVPVISLTFGTETTSYLENLKDLVNFGAPTLLIVAVLVGATGYYGYTKIAWWLSFGFWISIAVLIINVLTKVNWLNFGIFWIIIGTLVGLFFGCAFELVSVIRRHREHFLIALLSIGMVATAAATFVSIQNGSKEQTSFVTIEQAQQALPFVLYRPALVPARYAFYEPKIFVLNSEFHMYYGDDGYPPPPVIDFLKGLEIIEAPGAISPLIDSLDTYARVKINGVDGRYREERGRTILEWQQGGTYIVAISHSAINGKDLLEFARSFTPFTGN